MPFSELFMFSKGKFDSSQQRTSNLPADFSFQGHSDNCELVWDQGQVSTRNQSNKGSSSNNLPFAMTQDAKNSKLKFSSADSVLNDFPLSAPPCDMSFDEDEVPWASCPVVEPFNNVYSSGTLADSFGVTKNETAKLTRLGDGQASSSSTGVKLQKSINPGQLHNSSGLMNFANLSRFASVCNKRSGIENEESGLSSHNHMESTFVKSSVGFNQQESGSNAMTSLLPPSKKDLILPEQPVARFQEPDGKAPEPAVAASSVCSGNSLERDSNNPPSSLKRKGFETGDSEGPSDEAENDSVGVWKTSNRSAFKRSRAAEVHNQSERKRRERINEKMRALQELIPNCNKVDKASMLDEAIEYLKTLQLQVQILSMGTGMYMSQMMLPAAMQHMYRPPISQFSPMGFGMGAPFDFGMNMPDLSSIMQMPSSFPVSGFNGANSSSQALGHHDLGMQLPMGNVSGMPLLNQSLNQPTNQETMVLNEAENTAGLSNTKHGC